MLRNLRVLPSGTPDFLEGLNNRRPEEVRVEPEGSVSFYAHLRPARHQAQGAWSTHSCDLQLSVARSCVNRDRLDQQSQICERVESC